MLSLLEFMPCAPEFVFTVARDGFRFLGLGDRAGFRFLGQGERAGLGFLGRGGQIWVQVS